MGMQVKGTAVRGMLLAIEKVAGAQGLERVKEAMPPEVRALIEPTVLAASFYPVEVSASLQLAVRDVLGGGSLAMNHRIGSEAARIDFGGVYTVFLRVADYETTLRRLDRAWRQYNSQGRVDWHAMDKTSASGTIADVEGYNDPMWHSIAGRVETILILAGAKKSTCLVRATSPRHCDFDLRWTR